jgi:hypothetical protein
MRSDVRTTLPVVLAALALLLTGSACNAQGNRPTESDSVIIVTGIAVSGASVASTADTTASLTLTVESKNTDPTSFFSDVTLTNYTVTYTPGGMVPDIANGVIASGYTVVGGGATLILTMVANGSKPAAGTVVAGDVHVEGHDFNGRALSFDVQVGIQFTP